MIFQELQRWIHLAIEIEMHIKLVPITRRTLASYATTLSEFHSVWTLF